MLHRYVYCSEEVIYMECLTVSVIWGMLGRVETYIHKIKTLNYNTPPFGQITLICWNLPISNPKTDLHNINAHTKFGENPLMFYSLSSGNEKRTDGRTTDGQTHGRPTWNHNTPPLSCGRGIKAIKFCLLGGFRGIRHWLIRSGQYDLLLIRSCREVIENLPWFLHYLACKVREAGVPIVLALPCSLGSPKPPRSSSLESRLCHLYCLSQIFYRIVRIPQTVFQHETGIARSKVTENVTSSSPHWWRDVSSCRPRYNIVPCAFHTNVASRYMLRT